MEQALIIITLGVIAVILAVGVAQKARGEHWEHNPQFAKPTTRLVMKQMGGTLNGWMRIGVLISFAWIASAPFVVGHIAEGRAAQSEQAQANGETILATKYRIFDLREYLSNNEIFRFAGESLFLWAAMWLAVLVFETLGPIVLAYALIIFVISAVQWVHAGFKRDSF